MDGLMMQDRYTEFITHKSQLNSDEDAEQGEMDDEEALKSTGE